MINAENVVISELVARETVSKKVVSVDEALRRVKEGEPGESFLVAREKSFGEGLPKHDGSLVKKETQLLYATGLSTHHIRMYKGSGDLAEYRTVYEMTMETGEAGVYLRRLLLRPRDLTANVVSELHVCGGEAVLIGKTPKKIDFNGIYLRGELQDVLRKIQKDGFVPERLRKAVSLLKFISLDVDGCEVNSENDNGVFDMEQIRIFAANTSAAKELGIESYINTGRGVGDVKMFCDLVEQFGGRIDYAMCENGSVFYDRKAEREALKRGETGGVFWKMHKDIPPIGLNVKEAIVKLFIAKLEATGLGSMEEGKAVGVSVNGTAAGFQKAWEQVDLNAEIENLRKQGKSAQPEDFKDIDVYRIWIKNMLLANKDQVYTQVCQDLGQDSEVNPQEVEAYLEAIVGKIKNSATAVDINPCRIDSEGNVSGINKSDGVDFFAQQVGLTPDEKGIYQEIAGVGDSDGDTPALSRMAFAAIVWNSTSSLRYNRDLRIYINSPDEGIAGVNHIYEFIIKIRSGAEMALPDNEEGN